MKLQIFLNQIKEDWANIYFIHDFEKGLVKAIQEYFSNSKSIGCYYHYCKSLWVYAKKHQIYIKKNNREIIFILLAYKIYPFIKNKDEYINKLELMINKSENKIKLLKLHKYFIKYWKNQKLLNYNEYLDNHFYDTINNFSESFNYTINKYININHPKISIFVEKLKSFIKQKIHEYYNNKNKNKDLPKNLYYEKYFILNKIKIF